MFTRSLFSKVGKLSTTYSRSYASQTLEASNFKDFLKNNKNVVVDFYAEWIYSLSTSLTITRTVLTTIYDILINQSHQISWCGPCRQMAPKFEDVSNNVDNKHIAFGKLDIDSANDIAAEYDIASIPLLILFENGQVKSKLVGSQNAINIQNSIMSSSSLSSGGGGGRGSSGNRNKNKDNRRDRDRSSSSSDDNNNATPPPKLLTKSKVATTSSSPISSGTPTTTPGVQLLSKKSVTPTTPTSSSSLSTPSSSTSSSTSSFNIKKRESIDNNVNGVAGSSGYPTTPVTSPISSTKVVSPTTKEETSSPQYPHYQHHHHQKIQQQHQQQQQQSPLLQPQNDYSPNNLPLKSVKLLDKSLKISINDLLKLLTKDDGFMVIGVLGGQSTGKSTILSSLANTTPIIRTTTTTNGKQPSSVVQPFDIQTDDNFCLGSHQTNGIDVYITPERLIYIDTQPLQSISIVTEMIEKSAYCPAGYTSYEHYHYLQCIKTIIFLYSICNVVLIVQENKSIDILICNLIKSALMLKNKRMPDITNYQQQQQPLDLSDLPEYMARTLFVFNKLTELDYEIKSLDTTLATLLRKISSNHPIETIDIPDHFIYSQHQHFNNNNNNNNNNGLLSPTNSNSSSLSLSSNFDPSPINFNQLQQQQEEDDEQLLKQQQNDTPILSSFPSFNESIDTLKKRLLSLKSSTKFLKSIGERDWAENASKLWEYIQDDDIIESYNKLLITKKFRN
ncbi:hypothetical protein DFA_05199 [Cavenderia fasciculata]|uniref:Thioredoxin domain-containing protein n=1 Tax=Cavenderia fasciculata TaxID=261658 RepID=F4PNL6_CACFS|nr:uncharacterized protein DFA_05199 [Cavenderia fasciculata]EGG23069.1 hypothetical protein DFA_05199 [Cavenderia fasciculata]|eukprot:XP_004360920.1 hypothetical protein DFA_05199 [Cavenderia fasciculata]